MILLKRVIKIGVAMLGIAANQLLGNIGEWGINYPLEKAYECTTMYSGKGARVFRNQKNESMNYRLLVPPNPDKNKKYPLILILHGTPGRGRDNLANLGLLACRWAEMQDSFPAFLVVPQTPPGGFWDPSGHSWANPSVFPSYNANPIETERLAIEIIDSLIKEFTWIDENRIYITGASMGGIGTWHIIATWPNRFAAAIPIAGIGYPETAATIAHIPIWAWHGDNDAIISVQGTDRVIEAIVKTSKKPLITMDSSVYKTGGEQLYKHTLIYSRIKGGKHDSLFFNTTFENPQLFRWLFAQKKGNDTQTQKHSLKNFFSGQVQVYDMKIFDFQGRLKKANIYEKNNVLESVIIIKHPLGIGTSLVTRNSNSRTQEKISYK